MKALAAAVAFLLIAAPIAVDAQPTGTVWRVGILEPSIAIEWRFGAGQIERFPVLAAELARLKPGIPENGNPRGGRHRLLQRLDRVLKVQSEDGTGAGFHYSAAASRACG